MHHSHPRQIPRGLDSARKPRSWCDAATCAEVRCCCCHLLEKLRSPVSQGECTLDAENTIKLFTMDQVDLQKAEEFKYEIALQVLPAAATVMAGVAY